MEALLKHLGNPGRYHLLIATLFAITWWSVSLGNVSMTFYGFTPNYTCDAEKMLSEGGAGSLRNRGYWYLNDTNDPCEFTITNGNTSESLACSQWNFETRNGKDASIVTDFQLVCDNTYKISLSTTIFFLGVFAGAFVFGFISDQIGRKKTLALCLYVQIPVSFGIAFAPNWITFCVLRFILGVWLQGISSIAFLICIEFFRQKYRGVVMVGFGISWAFGQMLTALVAFLLPNWRHMQMFAASLALITVPYLWWLPESPRYLLIKEKFEEIIDIFVTRAAKINGLDVANAKKFAKEQLTMCSQTQALAAPTQKPQSFINMLKSKILFQRLAIMCFLWLVASMAYYGILLNIGDLSGNRYLNFAIAGLLEIGIDFVIIWIMEKFGRKRPLLFCCFLVAVLSLLSGVIPKQVGKRNITGLVTAFSLIGKMAMAAMLCLVWVYGAELFPTFARGRSLALCGCSLRIGGIIAPQLLYLREKTFEQFPFVVIAVLMMLCGCSVLLLPETLGMQMPNSLEDAIHLRPIEQTETIQFTKDSDSDDSEEQLAKLTSKSEEC